MNLRRFRSLLIFGGTFDPPHVAHVALPMLAAQTLGLEAVAYIPAARSPLKQAATQTSASDRLAMLRLAITENPRAFVLSDELERAASAPSEPSYTVDTLEAIRRRFDGPMRLLIGTDQMRLFDRWRASDRVTELAEPAVMVRPPDTSESLLAALPDDHARSVWGKRFVTLPRMDVSSTDVRERVRRGESIAGLVHPLVEEYIHRQQLYR